MEMLAIPGILLFPSLTAAAGRKVRRHVVETGECRMTTMRFWPVVIGLGDCARSLDWLVRNPRHPAPRAMLWTSVKMTFTGRRRHLAAMMYEHDPRLARRLLGNR